MEDTLRVIEQLVKNGAKAGLNPCFNGRYSQRQQFLLLVLVLLCLNPCFNGRYSQSILLCNKTPRYNSLNPCFNGRYSQS